MSDRFRITDSYEFGTAIAVEITDTGRSLMRVFVVTMSTIDSDFTVLPRMDRLADVAELTEFLDNEGYDMTGLTDKAPR